MNRKLCSFLCASMLIACTNQEMKYPTIAYVNPLIGTDYVGNTYPGPQWPFGMVQLSPDNGLPGWDRIAGYFYPDSTIAGFSHTHLSGTGAGDLYDISFMPVTLPYVEADAPLGIHSKFSHANETVEAGYYQVFLDDYAIDVELTATPRCGVQRYTFPEAESAVILNLHKAMNWDRTLASELEIIDNQTICGSRFSDGWARDQKIFFYAKFSKPFDRYELEEIILDDSAQTVGRIGQFFFATDGGEEITLKTAISGVSCEGAKQNYLAEVAGKSFDQCRQEIQAVWEDELSQVEVTGDSQDEKTVFYTALYHSMLAPTIYSDVDGRYYGPDKKIHQTAGTTNYSTFSLWDTYRASHPLFTLLQPQKTHDMVASLIAFGKQNGRLPVWNFYGSETDMMIGYHAVPVVADACIKGLYQGDLEEALEVCVASANLDDYRGIGHYKARGYIPYDLEKESLSKTIEYSFDDHAIAELAAHLGKDSLERVYRARAKHYQNLYNAEEQVLQPRNSKGEFQPNFDLEEYTEHITESNGWQYLFAAQHDFEGMCELMGGKQPAFTKLDALFNRQVTDSSTLPIFSTGMIGQYAHGNEPSHHLIYLFNHLDKPEKTQEYLAHVMQNFYTNTPGGLCGNEDCGQMSAWYVFSACGFYPVDPVSGRYELGAPQFEEVVLNLENGNQFQIRASNKNKENIYVKSVYLNGKPYPYCDIAHEELLKGGTLEFEMSAVPCPRWY